MLTEPHGHVYFDVLTLPLLAELTTSFVLGGPVILLGFFSFFVFLAHSHDAAARPSVSSAFRLCLVYPPVCLH